MDAESGLYGPLCTAYFVHFCQQFIWVVFYVKKTSYTTRKDTHTKNKAFNFTITWHMKCTVYICPKAVHIQKQRQSLVRHLILVYINSVFSQSFSEAHLRFIFSYYHIHPANILVI